MTCQQPQEEFDPDKFRRMFKYFQDETQYPDDDLAGYFSMGLCYLNLPCGACNDQAYYLMAAHLAYSFSNINTGNDQSGPVTSATVDRVSVSMQPPPIKSQWQHWLAGSPYGQQLWAWLSLRAAGGWQVGGLPEGDAFRKVGGVFGRVFF